MYQCSVCGLHYLDQEIAKKCAEWCDETQSCNLDITKFSVEASSDSQPKS